MIDWETGLKTALSRWATAQAISASGSELLQLLARYETEVQRERPTRLYPAVLAEVLRRIGNEFGVTTTDSDAQAFGASVPDWPAFADSAEALQRLQARFQLVVLSNVDNASFAASARQLGVEFDLIVTAEDVGSYKPDPANFQAMFDRLSDIGSDSGRLLHVAQSLFHDHVPAQALGLETVWIDRQARPGGATPPPPTPVTPTWTFPTLAAFAAAATS